MSETRATEKPQITEELVTQLTEIAGYRVAPERVGIVTDRLQDLYELAAQLDGLDLTGYDPAIDYDPTWSVPEGTVTA